MWVTFRLSNWALPMRYLARCPNAIQYPSQRGDKQLVLVANVKVSEFFRPGVLRCFARHVHRIRLRSDGVR